MDLVADRIQAILTTTIPFITCRALVRSQCSYLNSENSMVLLWELNETLYIKCLLCSLVQIHKFRSTFSLGLAYYSIKWLSNNLIIHLQMNAGVVSDMSL